MEIITEGALPTIPEPIAECSPQDVALAVDLGTTTVAVLCWSVIGRKILAVSSRKNAQSRFGSDVISRIEFSLKSSESEKEINKCIVKQLDSLFLNALNLASTGLPRGFRPRVVKIVVTGNTTMLSLLAGISVCGLSAIPFSPASKFDFSVEWGRLIENPVSPVPLDCAVYFPPIVGAFVGADTLCAMLSAGFSPDGGSPLLLADIGTNSEIALFVPKTDERNARIFCTAAAAGPAFEAANISCGMASVAGAVEDVSFSDGKFSVRTIGNATPQGVCGSGLIAAVSSFLDGNLISVDGEILGSDSIEISKNVEITQNDIRNFQLAKSALRTGIGYLLEKSEKIPEKFFLAGGFGSRIDLEKSARAGLIPENLLKKVERIGNAALFGASALLFSDSLKEKIRNLAKNSFQINLAAIPDFQSKFIRNIGF